MNKEKQVLITCTRYLANLAASYKRLELSASTDGTKKWAHNLYYAYMMAAKGCWEVGQYKSDCLRYL